MQQAKSVLDLQPGLVKTSVPLSKESGGTATLINLNPNINVWYVFECRKADGTVVANHLENAFPENQRLELSREAGLELVRDAASAPCVLWKMGADSVFSLAGEAKRPSFRDYPRRSEGGRV